MVFSPRAKPGCPSATAFAAGDAWWPKPSRALFSPIPSFPRRKGSLEGQGSSLEDAQCSKVQESQKKHYHVLSLLVCKCPYRSSLNLGVIHFFLCNIFLGGRKNSSCLPAPKSAENPSVSGLMSYSRAAWVSSSCSTPAPAQTEAKVLVVMS